MRSARRTQVAWHHSSHSSWKHKTWSNFGNWGSGNVRVLILIHFSHCSAQRKSIWTPQTQTFIKVWKKAFCAMLDCVDWTKARNPRTSMSSCPVMKMRTLAHQLSTWKQVFIIDSTTPDGGGAVTYTKPYTFYWISKGVILLQATAGLYYYLISYYCCLK